MSDPAPGTEYLSLEDLLDLVNALGAGPVRDLGLTDDEAFALTMSVAAGQPDADGICKQLRLAQAPP